MKKKKERRLFVLSLLSLVLFLILTAALCFVDSRPIGPSGSEVGLAGVNGAFTSFSGVHLSLYTVTDWLGILPILIAFCYFCLGLFQWFRRKRILLVDRSILMLGAFYCLVMLVFVLFEAFPLNFRPVLIEGRLEASYPSSTTLLFISVMSTAAIELRQRIKRRSLSVLLTSVFCLLVIFAVIARLFSGVHWLTDIVGGALLSTWLVLGYAYFMKKFAV